jgi:hypothetical protein
VIILTATVAINVINDNTKGNKGLFHHIQIFASLNSHGISTIHETKNIINISSKLQITHEINAHAVFIQISTSLIFLGQNTFSLFILFFIKKYYIAYVNDYS